MCEVYCQRVDVKEAMCEVYCGVMAWLIRVGGVGEINM